MNPFDAPTSQSLANFDRAFRADSYASGLQNLYTGLGDSGYDPTMGMGLRPSLGQQHNEYAQIAMEEEGMLRKAIHQLSRACTTRWGNVKLAEESGGVAESILEDMDDIPIITELDEFSGLQAGFEDSLNNAFMSGNGALIPMLDDGLDPSEPLDITKVRMIEAFLSVDRWSIQPQWRNRSGPPEYYTVNLGGGSGNRELSGTIHGTRVYWLRGIPRSARARQYSSGFDASLFESLARPYMLYRSAVEGSGRMIQDFDVIFHKIKDLAKMVCAAEEEQMRITRGELSPIDAIASTKLAAMQKKLKWGAKHRSTYREYVGDMEGEEFAHITRSVSGYRDLADYVKDFMGATSEFPPAVMFGEFSSSGMNSGGKSSEDRALWNDTVEGIQSSRMNAHMVGAGRKKGRRTVKPPGLLNLICAAKQGPTNGQAPKGLAWEWKPLYTPTPKEELEMESQASTIASTFAAADPRFMPNAILSRFGNNRTSAISLSPEYVAALEKEVKDAKKEEPAEAPALAAEAPAEAEPAEAPADGAELTPEEQQELEQLEAQERGDSLHVDAMDPKISRVAKFAMASKSARSLPSQSQRIAAKLSMGNRPSAAEEEYLREWFAQHRRYGNAPNGSPMRQAWNAHGGHACDRWLKRRHGHTDSADTVPINLRQELLNLYQQVR